MTGTDITPEILKGVEGTLAKSSIVKLANAGITTMEQLAVCTPREIIELTGMGKEVAAKAVRLAQQIASPGFITGEQLHEARKDQVRCTTGSSEFDRILGGGIEAKAITELIGEFAAGKSQTVFTLAVTAQRPVEEGGFGKKVVFIDTENTFDTGRVMQIAEARGYDPQESLRNIIWARAYNTVHQVDLITKKLHAICREHNVGLIIVDSMLAHLRAEYMGRGTLAERQQTLAKMLGTILRVSEGNNVAIVLTNQVQANPDSNYGPKYRAAGGHIMAHSCTYRVMFRKGRANTRLVQVIDSSHLPDEKIRVQITEAGIEDAEE